MELYEIFMIFSADYAVMHIMQLMHIMSINLLFWILKINSRNVITLKFARAMFAHSLVDRGGHPDVSLRASTIWLTH